MRRAMLGEQTEVEGSLSSLPTQRARKSKSKAEGHAADGSEGEQEQTGTHEGEAEAGPSAPASKPDPLPRQASVAASSSKATKSPAIPAPVAPAILSSNPHKPSVLPRPSIYGPRKYTLSVALPSSIVLNAQTMELKTRLVGSIARICAVFNVDEIIVFNEGLDQQSGPSYEAQGSYGGGAGGDREVFDPDSFTAMILQYLETPQYLRKQLFPMHPNLRLAGLLPPLDCPHHLRFEEESPYREGIVVEEPHYTSHRVNESGNTVWVNVGSREAMQCRVAGGAKVVLPPSGARVTVEMPKSGRGMGEYEEMPGTQLSARQIA